MRAINANRTKENYSVHRFLRGDYFQSIFNFIPNENIFYNLMMIKKDICLINRKRIYVLLYGRKSCH